MWELRHTRGDLDTYKKVKRLCPVCSKEHTDEQFFRSACFRKIGQRKGKQNERKN